MNGEAMRLWADNVATAEDIELGIKPTFGFRMFYEGPMTHYDLAGIWRWPDDVRLAPTTRRSGGEPELSAEAAEKIRQRYAEGTPWFFAPAKYEEETAQRDRAYIRHLKELYWTKGKLLNPPDQGGY